LRERNTLEGFTAKLNGQTPLTALLVAVALLWNVPSVFACPACWRGYGPGAERFNKPLADLRIEYEKRGKDALPIIREALKTSDDPLVQQRAVKYIGELNDQASIPLLENTLAELIKRVSFSTFGVSSYDFQTRLTVAHTLKTLGALTFADRIWVKYDQLDSRRKSEVPYILSALNDPKLTERLLIILQRRESHQLMLGALDVLALAGDCEAVASLKAMIDEWNTKSAAGSLPVDRYSQLEVLLWTIGAKKAIAQIELRNHVSSKGE
jgi:HEAT repeat protein